MRAWRGGPSSRRRRRSWRRGRRRYLIRDPRFALHSGSRDPDDGWAGDAKVADRAEELSEDEIRRVFLDHESSERMHSFRLDIDELVVVGLDEAREHMVIESWHPGRGVEETKR